MAAEVSKGVRISLGGRTLGCELIDVWPDSKRKDLFEATCAATLAVPSGSRVPLRLEYDGKMILSGQWAWEGYGGIYDAGVVNWQLAPAGRWGGPTDSLRVVVDAGKWAGRVECEGLPGAVKTDAGCEWRLMGPDLNALPPIRLKVHTALARRHRELTTIPPVKGLFARASSTRAPEGPIRFDAQNVLDGRAETAWCQGEGRGASGEWIEIYAGKEFRLGARCRLKVWVISTGHVGDREWWTRNARPMAVQLSPCGKGGPSYRVELEQAGFFDEASTEIHPTFDGYDPIAAAAEAEREWRSAHSDHWGHPAEEARPPRIPVCARLTILEATPPSGAGVCISELRPIVTCVNAAGEPQ